MAHYEVMALLGMGGMGEVYLARDTRLDRKVALKLISEEFMRDTSRLHRFEQEAKVASALNHPNIITVYEIGHTEDQHFIAIEYVEGETLRKRINAGQLPLRDALDIAKQIAAALAAAHDANIVHRDIKPENIMVRPDGLVKVLDFGLAKQTERRAGADANAETSSNLKTDPGTVMGTPHYMSPEQARGVDVDARTDIFSLGAVLFEMVTRRTPFEGETGSDLIAEILKTEPPPIDRFVSGAPAELQQIITQAMRKRRELRYQSAREMVIALKAIKHELKYRSSEFEPRTPLPRTETDAQTAEFATQVFDQPTRSQRTAIETKITPPVARAFSRPAIRWGLGIVALAAILAVGGYFFRAKPMLSGRDTILLADFVNQTGDPVFDGTLKQALSVQLGQSPHLNLLPAERVRETLKLMSRSPEERITREIGREICLRRNLKALLIGTITKLDGNYSVTLEALNSQTGETLTSAYAEADGRGQVLKALGKATRELREELGESLVTIRKFDVPIEQATTSSLEALKDFSAGVELRGKGEVLRAISLFKSAVEKDDRFALACLQLGVSYRDLRQVATGNKYLEQAYLLRDRVSERERLEITATYFRHITGEWDKRLEASMLLTQTYPQDARAFHLHGNTYLIAGQYEKAAAAYREALRLDADYELSRSNLALALIKMGDPDKAAEALAQSPSRNAEFSSIHNRLYLIAFLRQDEAGMRQQIAWFAGKRDEYQIAEFEAWTHAYSGRLARAVEYFQEAANRADAAGLVAEKVRILGNKANTLALFGSLGPARDEARRALALLEANHLDARDLLPTAIQPLEAQPLGWTFALCGDEVAARALAEKLVDQIPHDTVNRHLWQPAIRATLELWRDNPSDAIQLLQPASEYESTGFFGVIWLRGQALLKMKKGPEAAAEFHKILDHRGWNVFSPIWPMAHLGLARAAAISGDLASARKAYGDLFVLWKDADPDLPLLLEAKREFAKLR
ncbi:MAG: protein kinase [Blastocatellia bacterium]|nr:protein kinase [Blastocatellia bacterium]